MRRQKAWARVVATLVALVMGFTLAAPLAAAEAPAAPQPVVAPAQPMPATAGVKPTLAAAATRAAEGATAAALVQDADPAPAESNGGGLLSSTKGKVALALFLGGIGWTVYSAKNDRDPVKSPIR